MNNIVKAAALSTTLIFLQACADDSGGSSPTNPDIEFTLFSADEFIEGETSRTSYSGSDNYGDKWSAIFSSRVDAETNFMNQPAIPVYSLAEFTNTSSGGSFSAVDTSYWSTSALDRHFLGSRGDTTTVSAQTTAIPQHGKVGDFGNIGIYTDNAGSVTTSTWRLDDAGNGHAEFVQLSTMTNQSGGLIATVKSKSRINANGNTLDETIVYFIAEYGDTLTLNRI